MNSPARKSVHADASTENRGGRPPEGRGRLLFPVSLLALLFAAVPAAAQQHAPPAAPQQAPAKAVAAKQPEPPSIRLSAEKRQLIGVRTAPAQQRSVSRVLRTVGKVDAAETRLAFVNTKIAGWVRKLYVDYTGKDVKKGEPLLSIYSPDLLSAQEEYLLAQRTAPQTAGGQDFRELAQAQESLLDSAKRRLLLWDITPEQIAELERTGKPQTEMTIQAPMDGIVLEKMVLEGAYIMPGMNLYKIADLSTVWILADIYEYELPLVRVGQQAGVELPYYAGRRLSATVSYIYPTLDPMSRTVKVRIVVKNSDRALKPEMFANVEIHTGGEKRVAVPVEAVLDSGVRKIVYVEKEPGLYEMREVKLGARGDRYVEVLSGIRSGERVVTSGNFLIDSETQLRGLGGGGHAH